MNTKRALILKGVGVLLVLCLTGCTGLDGYKRTYSVHYTGREGQTVGMGATLEPVTRSGK